MASHTCPPWHRVFLGEVKKRDMASAISVVEAGNAWSRDKPQLCEKGVDAGQPNEWGMSTDQRIIICHFFHPQLMRKTRLYFQGMKYNTSNRKQKIINNTSEVPRLQFLLPCCDHVVFKQPLLMNMNVGFYPQNLANASLRKGMNRRPLICYQAAPT